MRPTDDPDLDLVTCPDCAAPAEVLERFDLGGLVHVRLRCVLRHWFLMPAAGVPGADVAWRPSRAPRRVTPPSEPARRRP